MKTICILFVIALWIAFTFWVWKNTENKIHRIGIIAASLAAFFFSCMCVMNLSTKLLWIPTVLFVAVFGTCLYFVITDKKKNANIRMIAFAAGCIVSATVLMYVDSRGTSRDSRPVNPKPSRQITEEKADIGEELHSFDGQAAEGLTRIFDKDFALPSIDVPTTILEEDKNTLIIQPYKLSDEEKNSFITLESAEDAVLWLTRGKTYSDTKNGLFTCSVRNEKNEIIQANIEFKYLYPEESNVCFVSDTAFGDGSHMVSVHPIRTGSACVIVSSPQSKISKAVLVYVTDVDMDMEIE